jgi:hypothetical protein
MLSHLKSIPVARPDRFRPGPFSSTLRKLYIDARGETRALFRGESIAGPLIQVERAFYPAQQVNDALTPPLVTQKMSRLDDDFVIKRGKSFRGDRRRIVDAPVKGLYSIARSVTFQTVAECLSRIIERGRP